MAELIELVTVGRELRPARVAFLVDPTHRAQVRNAMGVASTLWGGALCPLVPVFRRRPAWWPGADDAPPTAEEIVRGYLESYDPDFIVSLVDDYSPPVMQDRLTGVHDGRVGQRGIVAPPVTLSPLLAHLYETRFRFEERERPEHVLHDGQLPLGDALLGCLNTGDSTSEQINHELRDLLGSHTAELTPELTFRSQVSPVNAAQLITPLSLGVEGFLYAHRSKQWTYVYLCSARRTWDALELWNMRAAGLDVYAVPVEWADPLSPFLSDLVGGRDVMVVGSPRASTREVARWPSLPLPVVAPPTFCRPSPPAWAKPPRVVVAHDSVECGVTDERIDVPSLAPPWASRVWPRFAGSWINALELWDDPHQRELAGTLPHDLADVSVVADAPRAFRDNVSRFTEGRLVTFRSSHTESLNLAVPTGLHVLQRWLAERGLRSTVSDPGRTLLEIARRLGGLRLASATLGVRGSEFLTLLEEGTRKHHLPEQHVLRVLRESGAADPRTALASLTHATVLRAGTLIDCPRCRRSNWISPEMFAETMECDRCLEPFPFPHAAPPRKWGYRPVGPFAVSHYAAGAYAALLACAALNGNGPRGGTWAPSTEIDGIGELDFAVWRPSPSPSLDGRAPDLVLGEAKSFDEFADRDIARMHSLRTRLGQGTLCFATLRNSLSANEHARLRELVRVLETEDEFAPVMILTGVDLFSRDWAASLGARAEAAGISLGSELYFAELFRLCGITQRLYLGLDDEQ